MLSRRKICTKVFFTDVVPAPDEPVTEMIGCLTDMAAASRFEPGGRRRVADGGSGSEHVALPEERRQLAAAAAPAVRMVGGDASHFAARAEDERHALMQRRRDEIEDTVAAVRRHAAGLLDEPRDRVRLVEQPQAPLPVAA